MIGDGNIGHSSLLCLLVGNFCVDVPGHRLPHEVTDGLKLEQIDDIFAGCADLRTDFLTVLVNISLRDLRDLIFLLIGQSDIIVCGMLLQKYELFDLFENIFLELVT